MDSTTSSKKPGYFDNCLYSSPPIPTTPEAWKVSRGWLAELRALPSDPSVQREIRHTLSEMQFGRKLQTIRARKAASAKENETV